ncbi:aspartyl/glutamyl-tRNA(Asn/Gln) amidotransferase subunit B [Erysipelotrichaceae bacterium]|nr:aspartyl/glutamyl-tRNA(Asn/Gln) amidotransferase subunit B [Erysipelotrichaceae bacterium]
MNNLEIIIGIEVHAELLTQNKIYSPVPVTYKETPNSATNVIDLGYPGVLPTVSKKVVELALKAALALNCKINQKVVFDRKNYFYPDTPKAYQITQDRSPIGYDGYLVIDVEGVEKKIGITRLHIEEDAGKSTHFDDYSLLDFNRQGVPLIEIVTDASIRSFEQAGAYIEELRALLIYLGVSNGKMEEGSMRCDANISLRAIGSKKLGVKTEIKNINSISNLKKALEIEAKRQVTILYAGGVTEQATWRYDDDLKNNVLMRKKETNADYRYFPEPDISPIYIGDAWLNSEKTLMIELPRAKKKRLVAEYDLPEKEVQQLITSKKMTEIFEEAIAYKAQPKLVLNWLNGEIQQYLNKEQVKIEETHIMGSSIAQMLSLIDTGEISSKIAKTICEYLLKNGGMAEDAVNTLGLRQLSNPVEILAIISGILAKNPQSILDYKEGKNKAVGFLIGQIMQETGGQVNPGIANKILIEELKKAE